MKKNHQGGGGESLSSGVGQKLGVSCSGRPQREDGVQMFSAGSGSGGKGQKERLNLQKSKEKRIMGEEKNRERDVSRLNKEGMGIKKTGISADERREEMSVVKGQAKGKEES